MNRGSNEYSVPQKYLNASGSQDDRHCEGRRTNDASKNDRCPAAAAAAAAGPSVSNSHPEGNVYQYYAHPELLPNAGHGKKAWASNYLDGSSAWYDRLDPLLEFGTNFAATTKATMTGNRTPVLTPAASAASSTDNASAATATYMSNSKKYRSNNNVNMDNNTMSHLNSDNNSSHSRRAVSLSASDHSSLYTPAHATVPTTTAASMYHRQTVSYPPEYKNSDGNSLQNYYSWWMKQLPSKPSSNGPGHQGYHEDSPSVSSNKKWQKNVCDYPHDRQSQVERDMSFKHDLDDADHGKDEDVGIRENSNLEIQANSNADYTKELLDESSLDDFLMADLLLAPHQPRAMPRKGYIFGDDENEIPGTISPMMTTWMQNGTYSNGNGCGYGSNASHEDTKPTDILSSFSIQISSLCVEPLSAHDILEKVECRSREVVTKYLPCVEFLVLCQQELRVGLDLATRRRGRVGECAMSTREFFNTYFLGLPHRFYNRNTNLMPQKELKDAFRELEALLVDVKKVEKTGKHEGMKNAFLGGMRDGESWGLRKWLSKNGGALNICNDIELIWSGLRQQDLADARVIEIAKRIRPKLRYAYEKLKKDVPKAYQEVSSAHPYLPFFHRLESALKGLSEFDPEDDDVILLEDSSDDDAEAEPSSRTNVAEMRSFESFKRSDQDNDDSDVEIVAVIDATSKQMVKMEEKPMDQIKDDKEYDNVETNLQELFWRCKICTYKNKISKIVCTMCDCNKAPEAPKDSELLSNCPQVKNGRERQYLLDVIDRLACAIEEGREPRQTDCINTSDFLSYPARNYAVILRSFRSIILSKSSQCLVDPVVLYENIPDGHKRYHSLIKNPLGFGDIVDALVENDSDVTPGHLKIPKLKKWNMFEGKWLVQAIDVVMLNTLVFSGKGSSPLRKEITALRKLFWSEIRGIPCPDKKQMPPRRTEKSDFLLHRKT